MRPFMILAAILVAGCGVTSTTKSNSSPSPAAQIPTAGSAMPPKPGLALDPHDLTTALPAQFKVGVLFRFYYSDGLHHLSVLDAPVVDAVVAGARLTRVDGGEDVPLVLDRAGMDRHFAHEGPGGPPPPRLDFQAAGPLADAWYEFTLAPTARDMVVTADERNLRLGDDGRLRARFHVGSKPILAAVTFSNKGGRGELLDSILLTFSEPVRLTAERLDQAVSFASAAGPVTCVDTAELCSGGCVASTVSSETGLADWRLTCDPFNGALAHRLIVDAAGVATPGGAVLEALDGTRGIDVTLTPSSLQGTADGQRYWTP